MQRGIPGSIFQSPTSLSGIARAASRPGVFGLPVLIGLGLAALGTGCAADGGDESILVLKNVKANATTSGCSVTSTENETALTSGLLDVSAHTGYTFIAQLRSRITALAGQEDQRTIFVRGANIDITFSGSSLFSDAELADLRDKALIRFMAPFSGFIRPNGGISDVFFQAIPLGLVEAIAAKSSFSSVTALVTFTVVGTLGGGNVTSQEFQYPISIVSNGLLADKGACLLLSSSFVARVGNPCNIGQDGVTDCCTLSGNLVCPAVGMGD